MALPTTLTHPFAPAAADRRPINLPPMVIALLTIAAAAVYLAAAVSGRQALLFLLGTAAGVVLYHAAFGFTSSWREFVVHGRGAGIRAQMLMLAVTCLIFFPLLASGHAGAQAVRGSVSPVGVSVLAGAFLFAIGMQLGGGCASGTLYTAGGGNTRMLATLAAFIAGSVIATAHVPWWNATPATRPLSLIALFGAAAGLAASLAAFALIAAASVAIERRRHSHVASIFKTREPQLTTANVWRGPWSLAAGAAGLAMVNIATLAISGRPWGVTGAFALWGAKIVAASGIDVASWPYWSAPAQAAALQGSVVTDITSVMDVGIMLGALAAASAAGRFAPAWRVSPRSLAAAIVGGLLLGYGARIAYGCNIGALFSGIASGSLHGWVWMAAALCGTAVGVRLRPIFGLR